MNLRTAICGLLLVCSDVYGDWFPTRIESPSYPPLANQARIEGVVRLRLTLGQTGNVLSATVLSGNPVLARAAQINVLGWRFAWPCSGSDLQAPASVVDFTYEFQLKGVTQERATTSFRYDHPYKVTVGSRAQHWTPGKTRTVTRAK